MGEMRRSKDGHAYSLGLVVNTLREEGEKVTQELLPERWVNLITRLNEQERREHWNLSAASGIRKPRPQRRQQLRLADSPEDAIRESHLGKRDGQWPDCVETIGDCPCTRLRETCAPRQYRGQLGIVESIVLNRTYGRALRVRLEP
jgi:hypothetical protein